MSSGKTSDETDGLELPDHLLRWTEAVGRRVGNELATRLPKPQALPSGRSARLLQMIPADGMRITDLAQRARVTKQALGQLVKVLESRDLVRTHADPSDARVRIVRPTTEGARISQLISETIMEIETELAAEVGPRRYAGMKKVLRELGADQI
jgi:DNA-binding MarR family transcriptional regulator